MSVKLGMNAKLYYKTGGAAGAGAWVEQTNVKDLTLELEAGEADVSTRANAGWAAMVSTLRKGSIQFDMVWDPVDAGFTAIKDAFLNGSAIGFLILDGDKTLPTSQGLKADFAIINFSRKEPLEEAITVSVTAKPTYSATAPAWVTGPVM